MVTRKNKTTEDEETRQIASNIVRMTNLNDVIYNLSLQIDALVKNLPKQLPDDFQNDLTTTLKISNIQSELSAQLQEIAETMRKKPPNLQ